MSNCPACASVLSEGVTTCPLCGYSLAATHPAGEAAGPGGPRAPTRASSPRPPTAPRPPGAAAPGLPGAATGAGTRPSAYGVPNGAPAVVVNPPPSAPTAAFVLAAAPQGRTSPIPTLDPSDGYIGSTIAGKFHVTELLGQGGMGKVYKARHIGLDKIVCVKMLKPALLEDATIVGRFEREAKASSRLNHPNSIQVLDFGQDEYGALYIVMEFVSGKDLRKTLRDEFPLGEERICHIMAQVLSALAEAHAMNVIHRDLKPENIMLEQRRGESDVVKVLDFGIAKIQDPDVPGLTRADVVCGTPLYMSPEQATGAKFDARADLYAIGVILYQLCTGTLPFDGANSMEILTKHVTELPVPPRTRRPEVAISPDMELLILRALDKEAAGRPANADEFRAEILRIRDRLKRQRENADEAARNATAAHKESRQADLKARQAAQLASFAGGQPAAEATDGVDEAALPRSKLPLFAGIGVGVVAVVAGLLFVLKPAAPAVVAPPVPAVVVVKPTPPADPVVAPPVVAPVAAVVATPVIPEPPVVASPVVPVTPEPMQPTPVLVKTPPPPQTPLRKGDTAKAKELLDEADVLLEEEEFAKAVVKYREALEADPSFAKGYKGLVRAGTAAGDPKAVRVGLVGYLRAAPDAPDAGQFRRQLQSLR